MKLLFLLVILFIYFVYKVEGLSVNDYIYDDGDPDSTISLSIEGGSQIFHYLDSNNHIVTFSTDIDSSSFTENFTITASRSLLAQTSTPN